MKPHLIRNVLRIGTMYISGVDVFLFYLFFNFLTQLAESKGGVRPGGSAGGEGQDNSEEDWPTKKGIKYMERYRRYFTASGLDYAANKKNADRTDSVCENYEPYFSHEDGAENFDPDNDTVLGEFPCPMEKDPDDFGYCCGDSKFEYCCRLVDTFNFRLWVGMSSAAVLGIIIAVIVCVCFYIKNKKTQRERKKSNAQHMQQMGIAVYETRDTKHFVARQSDDGYHILTKFKKKKFYAAFWTELHTKYQKLSWKLSRDKSTKEVKVAFQEGGWVSIIVVDELDGYPQMVVSREKDAIKWMNTTFEEICDKILGEDKRGGCGCFGNMGSQARVQPTNENPKAKKYTNEDNSSNSSEKKEVVKSDPINDNEKYNPEY